METEEILRRINSYVPDLSGIRNRTPLGNEAMIYKCGWTHDVLTDESRRCIEAHCTACGRDIVFEIYSNGRGLAPGFYNWASEDEIVHDHEALECPNCGERVIALHTSNIRSRPYAVGVAWPVEFRKFGKELVILQWCAQKEVDRYGRSWVEVYNRHGMIVTEKGLVRLKGYKRVCYDRISEREWYSLKTWKDDFGETDRREILNFRKKVLKGTWAEKSGLEDVVNKAMKDGPFMVASYMKLWRSYPAVENLVRQGFGKLLVGMLKDSMESGSWSYSIAYDINMLKLKEMADLKAAKPHEMLKVKKEDLGRLRDKKDLHLLKGLQFLRQRGVNPEKLTDEEAAILGDRDVQRNIEEGTHGFFPAEIKMAKYLAAKDRTEWLLKDYWNMVGELNGGIPESMRWPKDLRKAHDKIAETVRLKRDEMTNEAVKKAAEKAAWMCFTDRKLGLTIRPAADQAELIAEGKALSHCVASYAKYIAKGETLIFFIRKTRSKKKSFFTLEYKNGKVNQNRGDHNCDRTPEVIEFEAKWLKYLEEAKNGKLNGKRRAS